ncbi:MAG: hypothetical protein ABJD24_13755 [Acidimicrobiales bacterium]
MQGILDRLAATMVAAWVTVRHRLSEERAEGVISMAIAVLIVAVIGAAAFVLFRDILDGAGAKASTQVNNIGN